MKHLPIIGAVLFVLGFAMATGVDQNPVQAIYAAVFIGGASICFNVHDKREKQVKNNETASMRSHNMDEAA